MSAFFRKILVITKILFFLSTLYCNYIQCHLFTNFGINSSKISSKQFCKCPIFDMVNCQSTQIRSRHFKQISNDFEHEQGCYSKNRSAATFAPTTSWEFQRYFDADWSCYYLATYISEAKLSLVHKIRFFPEILLYCTLF